MDKETYIEVMEKLKIPGAILTLTRAKKEHPCEECPDPIKAGEQYYEIYYAGSGLGGMKFPNRIHIRCVDKFTNRR